MNIIICGAGRVGFTIAKQLTEQNHSITIIDQSSEDIQRINDSLDVKAIVGKATMPSVLEKAHNDDTDMIIAVTKNDETNMLICQIAYSLFKIPKKIARIRTQDYLNPKFEKIYKKLSSESLKCSMKLISHNLNLLGVKPDNFIYESKIIQNKIVSKIVKKLQKNNYILCYIFRNSNRLQYII